MPPLSLHDALPILTDDFLGQAVGVAYGGASAYLGLWEQAFELLTTRGRGPIPTATAEALLVAALCARALDHQHQSAALLTVAYAYTGISVAIHTVNTTAPTHLAAD